MRFIDIVITITLFLSIALMIRDVGNKQPETREIKKIKETGIIPGFTEWHFNITLIAGIIIIVALLALILAAIFFL